MNTVKNMSSTKEEFERQGCLLLEAVLPPDTARMLHHYTLTYAKDDHAYSDELVPGAAAGYAHPCMERVLQQLLPTVEKTVGRSLCPTYSYFRVYKNGDTLRRHKDRPACEISLSVSLGYKGSDSWPLWIEAPGGAIAADLKPGDGVLYKGIELDHWREPFGGESASQVFFHYVDRDGPHAEWRFDKRANLRLSNSI